MEYLEIGQIVNTNGLKCLLVVNPFTDDIRRFENLETIYIVYNKQLIEKKITDVKYKKNQVLLKLSGIDTIEEAEKFRECYLKIDRKDAIKLPKDTYFIVDLIGLEVYTVDNGFLGKIDDIFQTGSNDVYVIKDELGKQILLPAISDVVKKVDIDNKKMIVKLIPGII